MRDRWQTAGAVAAAATLITLIETGRNYFANAMAGRSISWVQSLLASAPSWILLAALTPLPLTLARRVRLDAGYRLAAIALHLAGALVFAVGHAAALATYTALQRGNFADFGLTVSKVSGTMAANVMLYAAIVGGAHALRFYREARERELAESQLRASLTEARLSALSGQLNPHFLFNTLNAISTMAMAGRQDDVVRMLGDLGDLLRISLDEDRPQEVPLQDELDFLRRYLDIQRVRMGPRLTIHTEVDEASRDAAVPAMILQPIVENAIVHGIAREPGPGSIAIRARATGNELRLTVSDTGPGFDFEGRGKADGRRRRGIGLAGTRARLAELYGSDQSLVISPNQPKGTVVTITVPLRRPGSTA